MKLSNIAKQVVSEADDAMTDFKRRLIKHDWYYAMSDSSWVFDKGRREEQDLIQMAKDLGPEAIKLYKSQFTKHFPKANPDISFQ